MKVYDCSMFNWEFDLLEIRMRELWGVVDYFCVTESRYDHRGKERELVLTNNLDKFDWAKEKLNVFVSDKSPDADTSRKHERYHRTQSFKLPIDFFDIQDDDLLLISDIDEIFRASSVESILNKQGIFTFQMPMYYYYFNLYVVEWHAAKAITKKVLDNYEHFVDVRWMQPSDTTEILTNAGWHFGYLGTEDQLKHKLETCAHEMDKEGFAKLEIILDAINNKKDIYKRKEKWEFGPWSNAPGEPFEVKEIDSTFPSHIVNNKERYDRFIVK
jgi:hypothetical protein